MSRKTKFASILESAQAASMDDDSSSATADGSYQRIQNIPLVRIHRNPAQHRKYFDPDEQRKLRNSITKNGFRGAILLRPLPESLRDTATSEQDLELVYGESRFRAVEGLGMETIPAIIEDLTDEQVHRLRLDENLVRKDLNPIEEMEGLLEVASDELKITADKILSLLDEVDNASKRGYDMTGVNARHAEELQEVLDYYNKGTISGFRSKYRKLQRLPDDIKRAVQKDISWSKAVEIAPIKDPEVRKEVLTWATESDATQAEIRKKRKEIKEQAKSKGAKSRSIEKIIDRANAVLKNISNADALKNAEKRKQMEHYLSEIEKLMEG